MAKVGTIETGDAIPMSGRAKRRDERVRIVEHRLHGQTSEVSFVVACGTDDLDGLELVAVFEHRVRDRPALNICGPGDQCVAPPESNGFSVPLRNFLSVLPSDQ